MLEKNRFEGDTVLVANPGEPLFTVTLDPFPDHPSVVTVHLTERDGKTYVRVEQLHQSVESRDAHIASGMELGMRETLDRLAAFLSASAS